MLGQVRHHGFGAFRRNRDSRRKEFGQLLGELELANGAIIASLRHIVLGQREIPTGTLRRCIVMMVRTTRPIRHRHRLTGRPAPVSHVDPRRSTGEHIAAHQDCGNKLPFANAHGDRRSAAAPEENVTRTKEAPAEAIRRGRRCHCVSPTRFQVHTNSARHVRSSHWRAAPL